MSILEICQEVAIELNRLYKQYGDAAASESIYSIAQIRKLFDETLEKANAQYEFIELNSIDTYEALLGDFEALRTIVTQKSEAFTKRNYEEAAMKRDFEKKVVKRLLNEKGFDPLDHFFCAQGKIYYKVW